LGRALECQAWTLSILQRRLPMEFSKRKMMVRQHSQPLVVLPAQSLEPSIQTQQQ